ncbi:MAG: TrkA family potassium uptake protein [Acidobacteria bacterium]|nr:TrkA family potassium uptake protein [Acidobacteriota bacterium]MCW5968098.1 TrkA family potassium uptake protein [Blastocatellales bacterium]
MSEKKERFAVIGLGTFGAHVARTLYELGKDVLAVDFNAEIVQAAAAYATQAVLADATDRTVLESLGIDQVDAAIISLGQRMDVSTLAALHVRELGVPFIAVKALSEEHGRILQAIGVHEIMFPEKDRAIRLANRLARKDVLDFLPLLAGYTITEIKAPPEFVGRSLKDLALRNTLNVQLVAIQSGNGPTRKINIVPSANDVIRDGDLLILLGEDRDLDRLDDFARNIGRM